MTYYQQCVKHIMFHQLVVSLEKVLDCFAFFQHFFLGAFASQVDIFVKQKCNKIAYQMLTVQGEHGKKMYIL